VPQSVDELIDLLELEEIESDLFRARQPDTALQRVFGGQVLAQAIPGAELVELEGRSHLPAMGDAEAVVEQVRRFLGLPRLRRSVPTSLTPRQTEVAALVADGLTNRELAERLGITERSAESHLERIRLRLGFRSRSQVAAWYVAQVR
jgi:DNA-binding CsgD family transcriptional regulator